MRPKRWGTFTSALSTAFFEEIEEETTRALDRSSPVSIVAVDVVSVGLLLFCGRTVITGGAINKRASKPE